MSNGDGGPTGRAERRRSSKTGENKPAPLRNAGVTKRKRRPVRLAALDLGTNNCRLLIASPNGKEFRIVDAFSRIVRLGEGLSASGRLSDAAMQRTIEAIQVCADKIENRGVTHMRCIATQACRGASNGQQFLERVHTETSLNFEIINTEEEARLAVAGSVGLLDPKTDVGLVFDIGGGSTELSWLKRNANGRAEIVHWASLPIGVVNVSEKWGGRDVDKEKFSKIVAEVRIAIAEIGDPHFLMPYFTEKNAHLLGTSGTVTSIAGVHLKLPRYRRDRVDGLWLSTDAARATTEVLRAKNFDQRAAEPCIGSDRADLVVSGCAILEALLQEWPTTRIRVADRGLREGILADLARKAKHRKRGRKRRKRSNPPIKK